VRLNDPDAVRREYADESRFTARQSVWARSTGEDVHERMLELLKVGSPKRILEVGPGKGEFAERLALELGADVVAVDQSERMVELTRERGIDARIGDVQDLPFPDESFDAAIAAWMLYHVPDVGRGLSELARVLRPGGRLVAVTNSESNLLELWSRLDEGPKRNYPFSRENGEIQLARRFAGVERHDIDGDVTFPDWEAARSYVEASPTRSDLLHRLKRFEGSLVARRRVTVFVATK
jgi:SAM-dependent methyltransferase